VYAVAIRPPPFSKFWVFFAWSALRNVFPFFSLGLSTFISFIKTSSSSDEEEVVSFFASSYGIPPLKKFLMIFVFF